MFHCLNNTDQKQLQMWTTTTEPQRKIHKTLGPQEGEKRRRAASDWQPHWTYRQAHATPEPPTPGPLNGDRSVQSAPKPQPAPLGAIAPKPPAKARPHRIPPRPRPRGIPSRSRPRGIPPRPRPHRIPPGGPDRAEYPPGQDREGSPLAKTARDLPSRPRPLRIGTSRTHIPCRIEPLASQNKTGALRAPRRCPRRGGR